MSLRKVRYRNDPLADANMTNLIDVIMVLLIVFILVSNFVQTGLPITLPEVKYVEFMGKEKIVAAVDQVGKITLNGQIISKNDLPDQLEKLKQEYPEEALYVQADKLAAVGAMMEVVSAAKQAGFKQVNIPLRLMQPESSSPK